MPAIVKASPTVLAGGVALVRYSVSQTSDLLLTVEAEFVALPSARDDLFKIGSPPPPSLLNANGFLQTLRTYGAPSAPTLVDCQVVRSNGLKTVNATYSVAIAATSTGQTIRIAIDPNGNVVLNTEESEASFEGIVDGTTTRVRLQADNKGTKGNAIKIDYDGTRTISSGITRWNNSNPTNKASLKSGDGNQVPSNNARISLSGGGLKTNTGVTSASFSGTPSGTTSPVRITAVRPGAASNGIKLKFNGEDSIDETISKWNNSNPSNKITLASGDGTQIPNNSEEILLSGGGQLTGEVIGVVDGAGANGLTGEVLTGTLAAGSALQEVTFSTSWQSLSGSAVGTEDEQEGINYSFSFDYLSLTATVSYSGEGAFNSVNSGYQGGVSAISNLRGIIPRNIEITKNTRDTYRTYFNSKGEQRREFSSVGYYYFQQR